MEIPQEGLVVLKFGSDNCPPCRLLKPVLEELKKENEGVDFIDVDIEQETELTAKYRVRSIPRVFFIRDGEIQSDFVGFKPKEEIQENINLLLE